ncbi:hypothetical protein MMC08_001507 [Hypocenomyce scalaris]|nr:hypothetical protein [Hypocenomyce scalaris]
MAHSAHPDDEVLSVSTTPTGSPTLVDSPSSPTRSTHAEISSISQTQQSDQGLRTIDLFNSADDSDHRRSVISNYPEGSIIGIKSPHETIFSSATSDTRVDSRLGSPTETARYSLSSDYPDGSSMLALAPKSPRRASVNSEATLTIRQSEKHPQAVNGEEDVEFATYPEGSNRGVKSPKSPADTVTSTSTTLTTDTEATRSTGQRAEGSLHIPFLPKSLRITYNSHPATEGPVFATAPGNPKLKRSQSDYWRQGVEARQQELNDATRQQELKEALAEGPRIEPESFFDPASGDEEDDGDEAIVIGAARSARVNRPQLVEHRSSRLIGKDGIDNEEDNPGPSRGKAARLLGTNVETLRALEAGPSHRATTELGYVNSGSMTAPPGVPGETSETPPVVGLGIQYNPRLNFQDGLRSHPVQRSKTVPSRPNRKVTFPPPPLEEIRQEHRMLRQSVVSTPYPVDGNSGNRTDVVVALHLSGHGGSSRRVGSVVVPGRRHRKEWNEGEKNATGKGENVSEFDDQKLFQLMRAGYATMRGRFRVYASARSLRSIHMRFDAFATDTDDRYEDRGAQTPSRVVESDVADVRLTTLFKSPKIGKGRHQWVDLIHKSTSRKTGDTIALELVEDWSVTRIGLALLSIIVASLAAALLWVFLGRGGGTEGFMGEHMGFKGAGGRLEAGMALGVLVLLVGWTGVGAWVGLSWVG